MEENEILKKTNDIVGIHGLKAEIGPKELISVGCQGDERTKTRVIILSGLFPKAKLLRKLSTEISNSVPINRVLYQIANKD